MYILGINAYHGDASAAIVADGQLIAAAEEERFNRIKHSAGFPSNAIRYCLQAAGIGPGEIAHVAVPRYPWAHVGGKILYALRMPRFALDRSQALGKFADIRSELARSLEVDPGEIRARFHRVEHHKAHLASAFFVSPFETATLLSADGLGDFASTMWGVGRGNAIHPLGAITFPHSLGLYYTAVTQYLGFRRYGDEYKVMGLAAHGEPEFDTEFERILRLKPPFGFGLGLEYFVHHRNGAEMTWREGAPVLGRLYSDELERCLGPARVPEAPVEDRHRNVASTLQARLEGALFHLLNRLYERTGIRTLCLAGGVAYNCVANGKIFDETPFEEVYVQPAAGDAGLAVGAAYYVYHQVLEQGRSFVMDHAYWGPEFGGEEIRRTVRRIADCGLVLSVVEGLRIADLGEEELVRTAARYIADGKVVGWFQGRMEWGPRALGNRSIVVDPRRAEMKDILNRRVKHREPFRPFAPSILEEKTGQYFEKSYPSPFMLMAYRVRPERREEIPAPTHVDGTGRLQTVSRSSNPLYWRLIREFENLTGVPVVLNTSFNENEPIVCTPEEAVECFLRTGMDVLALGNYLVARSENDEYVGVQK